MVLSYRHSAHAARIAEYIGETYRDYDDPGCGAAIQALTGFYCFSHDLDGLEADTFHYYTYLACGRSMSERGC